jgi:hypothetical protein
MSVNKLRGINITYNSSGISIYIPGEPYALERPIINVDDRLIQDGEMMFFQQKIMIAALGELRKNNVTVPITRNIKIDIILKSPRIMDYNDLMMAMKSIIDGLNKSVIHNDSLIIEASISFKNVSRRGAIKSADIIQIHLKDEADSTILLTGIQTEVIPKIQARPYKVDGAYDAPLTSHYYQKRLLLNLTQVMPSPAPSICGGTELEFEFSCSNSVKDVDNMVLLYLPTTINNLGAPSHITTIRASKTIHAQVQYTRINIKGDYLATQPIISSTKVS